MKTSRGSALVIGLLVVALVGAIGGIVYLSSGTDEATPSPVSDQDLAFETQIRAVIEGQGGPVGFDIEIDKRVNDRVRAYAVDPSSGERKRFFAIKTNDTWNVVAFDEEEYSCERMDKLGFAGDLIDDCTVSYPTAVTVGVAMAAYNASETDTMETEIIATVVTPVEPSCNCFTVESGGELIEVVVPAAPTATTDTSNTSTDTSDLDEGDTVVITGTIGGSSGSSNSSSSNSGSSGSSNNSSNTTPVVTPQVIEEVAPEDNEILNPSTEPETTNNDTPSDDEEDLIPSEPTSSGSSNKKKSGSNQSNQKIELING